MQTPVANQTTRLRVSDTTPPSAFPTQSELVGPNFKTLMGDLAKLFPQLPPALQDQARQAHGHVQTLIKHGHFDQAIGLMTHMKEMMTQMVVTVPDPPPFQTSEAPPTATADHTSHQSTLPAIPPLPSSNSAEIIALQRTVEHLEMKMSESSAVTLIARRVRDMDMEQKYFQLEARLGDLKRSVGGRLDSLKILTEQTEALAKRELKKRTVSRNPFCEHEMSGFCEFCVGRDVMDGVNSEARLDVKASQPPVIPVPVREDAVTREMVVKMQQTLKSYQSTLKDLLEERKSQIMSSKERGTTRRQ